MNLSERAKIKQNIMKETNYKTTVNKHEKQILCLAKLFIYINEKYEICEWCEGIEIRNVKDENDIRYIYGLNIETLLKVSALNENVYNIDELFIILTKMFDDNSTNCVPYIYNVSFFIRSENVNTKCS